MLLALHGGVPLIGLLWLSKQHDNWSLRQLQRARAACAPPEGE